jgi:cation diffusion facilitator CzcD-associated flavoprotein CzcO
VIPRMQRRFSERQKARYRRFPALQQARRRWIYWRLEVQALGFNRPRLMALGQRMALRHLHRQVPDAALRAKLTPSYRMGCKRVVLSDDYYPALARPDVDVVTEPIREVTSGGLTTADGVHHPADVLIYGTGFHVVDAVRRLHITGRGGVPIAEAWRGGVEAYAGTTVAGFPNLFILLGPNTGLGHNSVVFMAEAQIGYVVQALRHLDRAATVEVRAERQAGYNARLHRHLAGAVWSAGDCHSWYLDADGVNRTIWPGFSWRFATRLRRFDAAAYVIDAGNRKVERSTSP